MFRGEKPTSPGEGRVRHQGEIITPQWAWLRCGDGSVRRFRVREAVVLGGEAYLQLNCVEQIPDEETSEAETMVYRIKSKVL